ncbi:hypothetical protein BKA69DRAFT_1043507 [Paraphysoderma sedebokerense]|nr:hypothetical protein BKA69DRAFT_1043507 [Paraphysoderma sedebokerense]
MSDKNKVSDTNVNNDLEIEDEEGESIKVADEEHKQSIFQFIKNILGKDVDSVRVSVPLFLLEPISNLQYLAELDHVEYFVQTTSQSDPVERLICMLQLLVSGFKRGLKRAKKPLNPILGEQFHCRFQYSDGERETQSSDDKPEVILIGEQVSHHPPIAAFYAECPKRGIETTLTFDVKAKFTAPLMNCHLKNHSYASVYIRGLDETYRIEYPSANLVGVLTLNYKLMWTGSCSVICEKTGLKAVVTFKEKRWFGKETYDVTGSIFRLSDENTPIYNITGAWNGEISLEDPKSKTTRPLFAVSTPPTYLLSVPPLSAQSPLSSQNIWGGVVESMKSGDNSKATKLKTAIENKQRAVEKERKTKGENWVPKYFRWNDDEGWHYVGERQGLKKEVNENGEVLTEGKGDESIGSAGMDKESNETWVDAEESDVETKVDDAKSSDKTLDRITEGINTVEI